MKDIGKLFGGLLIVSGTTLGAGLLALPIISAHLGFFGSALLMLGVFVLMTYAAFIAIEINLYFGKGVNISSAAEVTLGPWARMLGSIAIMLLYYALLAAYIAAGSSTIKEMLTAYSGFPVPKYLVEIIYTLVLGGLVFTCTRAVDYTNRFLFVLKIICFLVLLGLLFPVVRLANLSASTPELGPLWFAIIPVFITSFGYHGSIPSVVDYVGLDKKKLLLAFISGGIIPLLFYIFWQCVTLGSLPLFGPISFEQVRASNNDVGVFLNQLNTLIPGQTIDWATNGFAATAIATSFLGVGIGLFDFFRQKIDFDGLKNNNRFMVSLLTFVIPFIFAIFYPQGFVLALKYAGVALTIIAIIIPALIVLNLRKRANYDPKIKSAGGNTLVILAFLIGVAIVLKELFSILSAAIN